MTLLVWRSVALESKSSSWKVSTENREENRRDRAVLIVIPCSPALDTEMEESRMPKRSSSRTFNNGDTTLVQRPSTFSCRLPSPSSGLDAQQMRTLCNVDPPCARPSAPGAALPAEAWDLTGADRNSRPIAKVYSSKALGTKLSASKKSTHCGYPSSRAHRVPMYIPSPFPTNHCPIGAQDMMDAAAAQELGDGGIFLVYQVRPGVAQEVLRQAPLDLP